MNSYCLVGFGEHTKSKIMPAIKNTNNRIEAIVSKKTNIVSDSIKIFSDLDDALNVIDKNTIFYVSTPPETHYELAKKILINGFNCFIEKPIFLNLNEFYEIQKISNKKSKFFYECFMYQFGEMHKEFLSHYNKNKKFIKSIDLEFCLPSIPQNTFRSMDKLSSSLIYDIGCYPISLINILSNYKNLFLKKVERYRQYDAEKFFINGNMGDIKLSIIFGISENYENYALIKYYDDRIIKFNHLFFGRKHKKEVVIKKDSDISIQTINDNNLFEEMIKQTASGLIETQDLRSIRIEKNIKDIELLIEQYINY